MARRPPKPCPAAGCHALTENGYCAEHARIKRRIYKNRDENKRFYSSSRWQKLRGWFYRRHPICAICSRPAEVVDHLVAIKDGGDAMAVSNLQSLCNLCHQRKRGQEAHHLRGGGSKSLRARTLDRQPSHIDAAAKSDKNFGDD